MQEAMRISEADVEISRHRISVFLSQHTAYELLPESGKVWIPFTSMRSYDCHYAPVTCVGAIFLTDLEIPV